MIPHLADRENAKQASIELDELILACIHVFYIESDN